MRLAAVDQMMHFGMGMGITEVWKVSQNKLSRTKPWDLIWYYLSLIPVFFSRLKLNKSALIRVKIESYIQIHLYLLIHFEITMKISKKHVYFSNSVKRKAVSFIPLMHANFEQ